MDPSMAETGAIISPSLMAGYYAGESDPEINSS